MAGKAGSTAVTPGRLALQPLRSDKGGLLKLHRMFGRMSENVDDNER